MQYNGLVWEPYVKRFSEIAHIWLTGSELSSSADLIGIGHSRYEYEIIIVIV